ncbi:MAG: CHAT domain-containing protein [Cyanobacteria bacterium J06633_8]
MSYFLGLFTFISVFLAAFPVEAVVKDGFSVAGEGVKVAQKQDIEKRKQEAEGLYKLGKEQYEKYKFQEALKTFDKALAIYREIGDTKGENQTLKYKGQTLKYLVGWYVVFEEENKALDYFRQLSVVYKQMGKKEAPIFYLPHNFGFRGMLWRENYKALDYYQKDLAIRRSIGDKSGEASSLENIAFFYQSYLREYAKSLEYYGRALAIRRSIDDKTGETETLRKMGHVYRRLGAYRQALDNFQQAIEIHRSIGDKQGEAFSLDDVAMIYKSLGESNKASDYSQQASAIRRSINKKSLEYYRKALAIHRSVGNKKGEAISLRKIGFTYKLLREYRQALNYYQQVAAIHRLAGNKKIESYFLHEIGDIYQIFKEYRQALNYYQQAVEIRRSIGDKQGEALSLDDIAMMYNNLGEKTKASNYSQQASAIRSSINKKITDTYHTGEGTMSVMVGVELIYSGKKIQYLHKALEGLQRKLREARQIGSKEIEAFTLANIGLLFEQKQPSLAIVFYKQSVSTYEQIRQGLRVLPKESQESYTKTVAHTYRSLADLLIQQDRILEAQQVLDLLKVQELKDYLGKVRGSGEKLVILRPEEEILQKYNLLETKAIEYGQKLYKLRKIPEYRRTKEQKNDIKKFVELQVELNNDFNKFSDSQEVAALLRKLSPKILRQTVDLAGLDKLRDDLKRLDAVMLYPLILEDRLELIITTPDSPPLRRTVPVKRTELNKVIAEFRQALEDRNSNAEAPAQKLYNWLIKPLEEDLKQTQPKTIIYAPDGQLRYIPLAALHDGKQWLIEKYRINNITAESLTDFTAKPQPQPKVLAGAFVKGSYNIQVSKRNYPFQGLPYAGKEVEKLTEILPKTTKLIDKAFNKDDTTVKINEYNIVHLATHAAFVTGEPSLSFILFGDGKIANLEEIGNWTLNNVDLVVLSACETGIGGFGNGEEILGLGYQFQSRGATATIASLWQVSDGGTQVLMNAFYNALQGKMTKAEALRQAQIALITDDYTAVGGERGIIKVVSNNASNSKQVSNKLKHPYYWAPFILIGNGL